MDKARGVVVSIIVVGLIFILSYSLFDSQFSTTPLNSERITVYKSNKTFKMCPLFRGRLGNMMFIYASSYAIALSKGLTMEIDKNNELLKIFKLTVNKIGPNSDCKLNRVRQIKEKKAMGFDRKIIDFCPTSSIRLLYYLQSHIYFNDHVHEVKKQFTFLDHIRTKAEFIIQNILTKYKGKHKSDITLIGVHIRRGDRVKLSLGGDKSGGFRVATKEYLERAVNWYEKRYNNIIFVVTSNGMDWAKKNMPKNRQNEFIINNKPGQDMAILSLCHHTITTFGTFSWWAGWLAGGNVTYFRWPATETGRFRTHFSSHRMDHYHSHWVGIDG